MFQNSFQSKVRNNCATKWLLNITSNVRTTSASLVEFWNPKTSKVWNRVFRLTIHLELAKFCLICYSDQGGYVFAFVWLSVSRKLTNSDEILWRVGCLTSNRRLDFGDESDHDAHPRIKKKFHCGIGVVRILRDQLPWRKLVLCECVLITNVSL